MTDTELLDMIETRHGVNELLFESGRLPRWRLVMTYCGQSCPDTFYGDSARQVLTMAYSAIHKYQAAMADKDASS